MKRSEKFWRNVGRILVIILNLISIRNIYVSRTSSPVSNYIQAFYYILLLATTISDLYILCKCIEYLEILIKKFNNWLDKDEITEGDDKLSIRRKKLIKILRWI